MFKKICMLALTVSSVNLFADEKLETVVVSAGQHNRALWDAPLSVSVLSEADIKEINAQHVNEIFFSIPNTWVSRGNGQEHLTAIRSPVFTGAGSCGNFLISEDAIPVRATGFCNANQLFDVFYETSGSTIVFRGPNSAVFGGNALFGGIDFTTANVNTRKYLGLEFGRDDYYQTYWNLGSETLSSFGSITKEGGYRNDASVDQQKIGLKNIIEIGEWEITNVIQLNNLEQETAGFIEGKNAFKDERLSRSNVNPEAYRDASSIRLHSQLQRSLNDYSEISITPYYRWNEMEFLMHFVPWQPIEKNGHESIGIKTQWYFDLDTLEAHVGLDVEHTQAYLTETQFQPAPFGRDRFPEGEHYNYDVDSNSFGAYIATSYAFLDAWLLDTNLRWDVIDYQYDNNVSDGSACAVGVVGCRFYRPADREDNFSQLSGRTALTYSASDNLNIYANISRGFRPPQATELYRLQSPEESHVAENTKMDGVEMGLRIRASVFDIQTAIFLMEQKNAIYQNSDREYLTGAETSHKGIEYSVNYSPIESLSFHLSGSYSVHLYENSPEVLGVSQNISGLDIDTAPRWLNRLSSKWYWRSKDHAYISMTQMGSYYLDPANEHEYEGHTYIDMGTFLTLSTKLQLHISIKNVGDTRYAERADIAFGEYRYFPSLPRRAQLSMEYQF